MKHWAWLAGMLLSGVALGGESLDRWVDQVEPKVREWRRDIHQNPELGFQEHRTAALVAAHLRGLGLDEVRTGVGKTGVVGILRGSKSGPVVALRADMDALPVLEQTGLPFASTARTMMGGKEVPVMHACGHDAHTAMLMGAAEVLAGQRDALAGAVVFLFQPAEEGSDTGGGGAEAMLADGALKDLDINAFFAVHVGPGEPGSLIYHPGPAMAASDTFEIVVHGRQTHGALPWYGIDPVTAAAQVVLGLQMIPSRQVDLTEAPAVITVGVINGGMRHNIVPDRVQLQGTIRTFTESQRKLVHSAIERTATQISAAAGAKAEVQIHHGYPALVNDRALLERSLPVLRDVTGGRVYEGPMTTGAEDFALFAQQAPGLYLWLGASPNGLSAAETAPNHSPRFDIDESAMAVGVKALVALTLDQLGTKSGGQ